MRSEADSASGGEENSNESRINRIIEYIIKVAGGDYSVQLEVSDKNDEIDSLAVGFNMMAEDIKNNVENIKKDMDIQGVLNNILSLQIKDNSIEYILEYSLKQILSIAWLSLESKGAVFLVENENDTLVMKVQNGFSSSIQDICAEVKFGQCFCGRAALTGEVQFADCIDERHDVKYEGMNNHGHYCIPIVSSGRVLGVINTYLKIGHKLGEKEEQFLKAVADILAKIIENKNIEKEKEKLQEKLFQSEKMSAIGKLASGVAHEINNPLTVILGYSQIVLKRLKEDNEFYKPLKMIEKETVRSKILVEQLLQFSRMQKVVFIPFDLNKAVEEIIQIVISKCKVSNIELIPELDAGVGLISGSKNQIQQVITNLCNNAIDASNEGGKVWVRTKHFKDFALLEVEDKGSGISEEIKKQVFEPFFTTKEVGKGTGLGLSLSFEIIKKHGFEITLESEKNKGSKFMVKIPYSSLKNIC